MPRARATHLRSSQRECQLALATALYYAIIAYACVWTYRRTLLTSARDFWLRGANPRITITGFHIKIDGCVGQSFIRSYATLTISTGETADVIAYMGVTKVV